MLALILSLCVSVLAQAAPIDLLSMKPEGTKGTIEQTGSSTRIVSESGFFSPVGGIFHKISFSGKSYDMKIVLNRGNGTDGIGLVIPVGQQKTTAVFGGWGSRYDGLNSVNGFDPSSNQNPTRRASKIVNGQDVEIVISVRADKVSVMANGAPHYELDTKANKVDVVSNIQKMMKELKVTDGLGIYILKGEMEVMSWTIEEKK
jgi:hypothetical protein